MSYDNSILGHEEFIESTFILIKKNILVLTNINDPLKEYNIKKNILEVIDILMNNLQDENIQENISTLTALSKHIVLSEYNKALRFISKDSR